jgi:hypothetical protein
MFEFILVLLVVAGVACSLRAKVLMIRVKGRIQALNDTLDLSLDSVKFGPDGEAARRETAERIGRIRK